MGYSSAWLGIGYVLGLYCLVNEYSCYKDTCMFKLHSTGNNQQTYRVALREKDTSKKRV